MIVLTKGDNLGSYPGGTDSEKTKEAFLSLKGSSRIADRRVPVEIFFDESRDGEQGGHEQYGNNDGDSHFAEETETSDRRDPLSTVGARLNQSNPTLICRNVIRRTAVGFLEESTSGSLLFNQYCIWRLHARIFWKQLQVQCAIARPGSEFCSS